uniref:Multidomain protein n=1 Tax=uncultured bacterium contig00036 TaxID=1181524 RepID=A0A806KJG7_9BACT|nr:multidomain protein [uncultured bacterium contig00036]
MNYGEISGNTARSDASYYSSSYGGGVYVNNGTFTMHGGEISGNTASSSYSYRYYSSSGGGVHVENGTFTMHGGEISGNTARSDATDSDRHSSPVGGVCASMITLGGTAVISGNTIPGSMPGNVYLPDGGYITLSSAVPPEEGMSVGVSTAASDGIFVNSGASAGDARYFFSDIGGYGVAFSSGQLVLIVLTDISTATVTQSGAPLVYTGLEQTPAFTVAYDGAALVEDTDYQVTVTPQINARIMYNARITGIGKYTGTKTVYWMIFKSNQPAPSAPALSSKTHNSVTLEAEAGHEYSLDGTNWQNIPVFGDLDSNTLYYFYQRIAETANTEASEASEPLQVTTDALQSNTLTGTAAIGNMSPRIGDLLYGSLTGGNNTGALYYEWKAADVYAGSGETYTVKTADYGKEITLVITSDVQAGEVTSQATAAVLKKAAPAAPPAPALQAVTYNSVTLEAEAGHEYSIDGINWRNSRVFGGLAPNTLYYFYQRIAETTDTEASATSPALGVTTDAAPGTDPGTGGTETLPGGSEVKYPAGTVLDDQNGTVTIIPPHGETAIVTTTDGTTIEFSGGISVEPDGTIELPWGAIVTTTSGTEIQLPEESVIDPDGTITLPDDETAIVTTSDYGVEVEISGGMKVEPGGVITLSPAASGEAATITTGNGTKIILSGGGKIECGSAFPGSAQPPAGSQRLFILAGPDLPDDVEIAYDNGAGGIIPGGSAIRINPDDSISILTGSMWTGAAPDDASSSISVYELGGNKNALTVSVTEIFPGGSTIETIVPINDNEAGYYNVGQYIVYADVEDGDRIRRCFIATR